VTKACKSCCPAKGSKDAKNDSVAGGALDASLRSMDLAVVERSGSKGAATKDVLPVSKDMQDV